MGLLDSISKKMEENAEKRKQAKEVKQQEDVEYKEILNTFKDNKSEKFEGYYFDTKNQKILNPRGILTREYRVYDFSDVLSYKVNKTEHNDSKTQTKHKHALTRAVVGGVLTAPVGGLGAIVGGFTGKKETTTISKDFLDHLGVTINFKDGSSFEIVFVPDTVKTDGIIARAGVENTNKLTAILSVIVQKNNANPSTTKEQRTPQSSPATDPLDEIKKLKGLLDIGAITQEEFDAKKKQLLNL